MDPLAQVNTPEIQQLGQQAYNAQNQVGDIASLFPTLGAKLKQAIEEKLNYNKDIIDAKNKAQAEYFAAPSAARSEYQNIWNPFDREKLVASSVANAYAPYASLTDILKNRMGTISDTVNAGTNAFQTALTYGQNTAASLKQRYQDAVDLAKWSWEQTHAKPSSTTPEDPLDRLLKIAQLKVLGLDENGNPVGPNNSDGSGTIEEKEPQYSPTQGEGAISYDNKWKFHEGKWWKIQGSSDGFIPD